MIDRQTWRIHNKCTRLQLLKGGNECPTDSSRLKTQEITALWNPVTTVWEINAKNVNFYMIIHLLQYLTA